MEAHASFFFSDISKARGCTRRNAWSAELSTGLLMLFSRERGGRSTKRGLITVQTRMRSVAQGVLPGGFSAFLSFPQSRRNHLRVSVCRLEGIFLVFLSHCAGCFSLFKGDVRSGLPARDRGGPATKFLNFTGSDTSKFGNPKPLIFLPFVGEERQIEVP